MEAENMTTAQRLVAECERLDAKFAADAGADLSRDELVARFIARRMSNFADADEQLRQSVTTMATRRYDNMFTCCDKVERISANNRVCYVNTIQRFVPVILQLIRRNRIN